MAFCSDCGNSVVEGAKFCSGCGSSLNGEQGAAATSSTPVAAVSPSPAIAQDPLILPLVSELIFQITNYDGGLVSHAKHENGNFLALKPDGRWELRFPVTRDPKTADKLTAGVAHFPLEVTETGASSCHVTVTAVQDQSVRAGFDVPKNAASELMAAIESLKRSALTGNAAQTRAPLGPPAWRYSGSGIGADWRCIAHSKRVCSRCGPYPKIKGTMQGQVWPNPKRVNCPHCQGVGTVTAKGVKKKKGFSTGKATAALLTGGISLVGTGLAQKGEVTQLTCSACGISWEVA
jgi:hypothetical protein